MNDFFSFLFFFLINSAYFSSIAWAPAVMKLKGQLLWQPEKKKKRACTSFLVQNPSTLRENFHKKNLILPLFKGFFRLHLYGFGGREIEVFWKIIFFLLVVLPGCYNIRWFMYRVII